jgi:hypothetical protein
LLKGIATPGVTPSFSPLGVDLTAGQPIDSALAAAFRATNEAIIADFLRRHGVQPQSRGTGMDAEFNANTGESAGEMS